jgi:hypothetical protein
LLHKSFEDGGELHNTTGHWPLATGLMGTTKEFCSAKSMGVGRRSAKDQACAACLASLGAQPDDGWLARPSDLWQAPELVQEMIRIQRKRGDM